MPFSAASYIREHRDEIIRAWEESLAASDEDVRLHGPALRDHLPGLLLELAAVLEAGDVAPTGALRGLAGEHALTRLDRAYGLSQLIREFRVLRETLLRLLLTCEAEEQARAGATHVAHRVVELATLNSALDEAVTSVVEQFVDERDRRAARAEHSLKESESRFRALADGSPVLIWVTDREGRIEFVNRAYCEFFGVTLEQVRAGGWVPLVHPDDAPVYLDAFARALREGTPFRAQARVRRADGAWRWVESYGAPRLAPDGVVLGVAGSSPDVTEAKDAADAIRASEERLKRILRHASAGLWEWHPGEETFTWSEENFDLFGVSRDETLSVHMLRDRIAEADLPHLRSTVRAVVDGRDPEFRSEFRVRHPDRGIRWILTVGRIERAADGARPLIAGLNLDITERKRAERELQEADQRKAEFLGVLSHELRNPLAPIRNSIYLLEHAAPDSEQAARAKEVLRRQTEHLTHLVDDLLDVTRISRGKIQLQRGPLDLREIVRKTTDDLHSVFKKAGVELRVEYATFGPVWIDADATRMAQVLGNLLNNAVKFTAHGGSVIVSVGAGSGGAELSVRDTGVGIEPEALERMFEPFTQAERTLARTQGGLGLGLALVRGLVELHGGTVEAKSEGLGRGAEFLVRLPITAVTADAPLHLDAPAGAGGLTILVIEDNLDAGETLVDILEMAGNRAQVARDGRSGIELAHALRPDVVLCDIGLPDIDGFEVARTLRADAALERTQLVALSGYAQAEDRERGRAAGFDAHLAKPPDIDQLLQLLRARSTGARPELSPALGRT
ncbi:MAG TPA: PAS domain S-box protein [Anaeromyxobacter sp.]|nr:PAS domain S-box protein [Anaeromyxobacter sp.]